MSYAFIKTMRSNPNQSYINACPLVFHILPFFNPEQVLQSTRQELVSRFSQIPQLSAGGEYDLNQVVTVRLLAFYSLPSLPVLFLKLRGLFLSIALVLG